MKFKFRFLTEEDCEGVFPDPKPRGNAPIEYDRTPVKCCGEELGRILWRGRQWAVTERGLECLDGCYIIDIGSLGNFDWHGLGDHMNEKEWADMDDFLTAWLVALALHGVHANSSDVLAAISRLPTNEERAHSDAVFEAMTFANSLINEWKKNAAHE